MFVRLNLADIISEVVQDLETTFLLGAVRCQSEEQFRLQPGPHLSQLDDVAHSAHNFKNNLNFRNLK